MKPLLLFSVVLTSTVAESADWPRFRGPNGTGISDAKSIPTSWTADDFAWTTDLPGQGHGSPIVVGDRIYLLSGDEQTAERFVLCVNATDGELLWRRGYTSTPAELHRDNNYASSTPAADADGVVAAWTSPDSFMLVALNNDGKEVWHRDLGEYKSAWGGAPCPIIVDDLVVILNDQMDPKVMARFLPKGTEITGPGRSAAIAFDRATGKIRWEIARHTVIAGYATPCVRQLDDGRKEIVFFGTGNGMTGVDPATGNVNWELNDALRSRTVMSPVLAGDLIIGSHGLGIVGDKLVAVRPPNEQDKDAEVIFELRKSIPLVPTAIYTNGLLFMTCETGIVTCVNATNGKEVWRERVRGKFYASPICIDDRLFCVDRSGNVIVLAAGRNFAQLASNPLPDDCFATPAVANESIYFRTASQLIALRGGEGL
ncbi:MAG: PQQ-binding-like beta-propeller repeat protein [Fuerstiella sp.]|nr:PQQ-binding-like beta-propeller repeat protein [Fuerstiella sp.]MCP4856197.1 PQQ-binding-like beta-propeller repeat protein [Fuerstiella sp.]